MTAIRYIVTGASGFIGTRLGTHLDAPAEALSMSAPDWRRRIDGAPFAGAVVMHLAGRAHRAGSADSFRRDNTEKTRALAEAASQGGARAFVFLSSIKVNGEQSARPFTEDDPRAPQDDYARSKHEAEEALESVARSSRMAVVIVRPPLVYGPGAKGHLATLLRVADSALPLPFAGISNRRSFIALDDLCRVLVLCASRAREGLRTYLVAHREAVSTPRLVSSAREALGRPPRLFDMPQPALRALAALCGQRAAFDRLTTSLECDPSRAERELGWRAAIGPDEAIASMVHAYRAVRR